MNGKFKTTFQKEARMKDEFLDLENPPITAERAQHGWVRMPDGVRIVPVKMDKATFQWFRSQGKDVSTEIEAVLRNYAESQRETSPV